jgi:hypothetical protein
LKTSEDVVGLANLGGPDVLEAIAPGWPKFETTVTCHTCRDTWKAVQTSPSKEILEAHYAQSFSMGDGKGHEVIIRVVEVSNAVPSAAPHMVVYEGPPMVNRRLKAVGYQIQTFIILQIAFSFIWAIIGYALFPALSNFQVTSFPSGVFPVYTLAFMAQLIYWFPFFAEWSFALYLWNGAQRKNGPEDIA